MRVVKTLMLVNDPELLAAYRKAHDEIWQEITEGIRSVGITSMELYLDGNLAVMVMEYPDGLDIDKAMARLATLPRQQEWENFVAKYQQCDPDSTSDAKWRRMSRIFSLPKP